MTLKDADPERRATSHAPASCGVAPLVKRAVGLLLY